MSLGLWKMTYTKDMKELEFEDVAPIYRKNYWDRVKADALPVGVDLCVFDFSVNGFGTGRGAKYLQTIVGALLVMVVVVLIHLDK